MGQSAALVDIDLQFGDVALTLGLAPEATFHDLAIAGGVLDQEVLEHYLVKHPSGVKSLLAPSRPDQASAVSAELIRDAYSLLRQSNDFVIVDTPPGFIRGHRLDRRVHRPDHGRHARFPRSRTRSSASRRCR